MVESDSIGLRLKQIRDKHGLTLENVGELFQLSKGSISRYEKGERMPDLEFIERFAKHFNVNPTWLINNEPPIFKDETQEKRGVNDLFLELSAVIDSGESDALNLSESVIASLDKLEEDTPQNYIALLTHMRKNPVLRRQIFQIFYILQSSLKKKEGTGREL